MPVEPILLLAPPGCGKTEALALRAAGLVAGGHVPPPRRVLALTFSNKARDNLGDRLRTRLGRRRAAATVTVQNFHGFSARVVCGHGHLIGIGHDVVMPDRRWAKTELDSLSSDRNEKTEALNTIREAKQQAVTDADVAATIAGSGNALAIELERRRLEENRLDFDDLLRCAVQLLEIDGVRRLYRAHFAAVLVDEMQDMTVRQLDLALSLGPERLTLAGDAAQGIYTFAGAAPDAVAARFEMEDPTVLLLTENYRSAPAVLELVSAMARSIGGEEVSCADEGAWDERGEVRVLRYANTQEEAAAILDAVATLLERDPSLSIGVVARSHFRKQWVEDAAATRGYDFQCWDRAVDTPAVRGVLQRCAKRIADGRSTEALPQLTEMCLAECPADDVDLRDGILDALDLVGELCESGSSLENVMGTLSVRSIEAVSPGLHFLNAHVGKGQQFDWVVVLGMEAGSIPSYLAKTDAEKQEELRVLHVMCSRARRGLLFTVARDVRSDPDREWLRNESPWLKRIQDFTTGEGMPV